MHPNTRAKRDLSLRDIVAMLKRQKRATITVFCIVILVTGAAFRLTRKTFRTTTTMLVDGRTGASSDASNDPIGRITMPASDIDLPTQIQVLQSGRILAAIFQGAGLGLYDPNNPILPKIKVDQQGETNVLTANIDAADPWTAQRVAESLPKIYLEYLKETREQELTNALEFLSGRLSHEQAEYQDAVTALQKFKAGRKLTALENEPAQRSAQVVSAQSQAIKASTDLAAAQQRLDTLMAEKAHLPKAHASKNVHANDAEIEAQKQVLTDLQAKRARLLTTWKEGTPDVIAIEAEIADQQKRLNEIPKVRDDSAKVNEPLNDALDLQIAEAKATVAGARAEANKSEQAEDQAVGELKSFNTLEPQEANLRQAITDSKVRMDATNATIEELRVRQSSAKLPVVVLSPPQTAVLVKPVAPEYILIGLLAGVVFAFGVALIKDHMEDRVSSAEDIYQICGMEPLAQMPSAPMLPSANVEGGSAIVRQKSNAALFDSYRLLRFNLLNAAERGYMGSLVVTSVTGSEGKSELACDLAEVMAAGGRRVILVDGNLRNPSLARHFGVSDRPGLTDVLIGDASVSEALNDTTIEGLRVLSAGAITPNPVDLLESAQMVSVHSELRELADLVIFDAPSCLNSADASVIASFTDSVLVVAELGTTKRDLLNRGVQMLQRSSAKLIGVVLREKSLGKRSGKGKAA